MEEALHDVLLFREFAGLDNWSARLPDESTILRFRHLLEKHMLAALTFPPPATPPMPSAAQSRPAMG